MGVSYPNVPEYKLAMFHKLVEETAICLSWSTVEDAPLSKLRQKLVDLSRQAEVAGLSPDEIQTAIRFGECLI